MHSQKRAARLVRIEPNRIINDRPAATWKVRAFWLLIGLVIGVAAALLWARAEFREAVRKDPWPWQKDGR